MSAAGIASVGLSLDGLKETHDRIRGWPGLFDRVLVGIEMVQEKGMRCAVLTTVNRLNLAELPAIFTLLRSVGIQQWQVQPIFPLGRAHGADELQLSQQDYMKLGDIMEPLCSSSQDNGLKIELADSFGYFGDCDNRTAPWRGGPAGLAACGIASDGKIKGCLSLPDDFVEGDLREQDFWDIWFHPDSFAFNRAFGPEKLGVHCRDCDQADLCKGGCSAMSLGSTGAFHNDPYCFYGIRNGRKKTAVAGCL